MEISNLPNKEFKVMIIRYSPNWEVEWKNTMKILRVREHKKNQTKLEKHNKRLKIQKASTVDWKIQRNESVIWKTKQWKLPKLNQNKICDGDSLRDL